MSDRRSSRRRTTKRSLVRRLGLVLVVGLVCGLPIVDSPPALADDLPALPPPLPPLSDSPDPQPDFDLPTVPTGDFSQPPSTTGIPSLPDDPAGPGLPVQPGPVVSRDLSSTSYDMGDGTSTVRLHNSVVNYQDDLGVWRAIDTRLVADTAAGDYEMASGPFEARVGAETGPGVTMLSVADDDWSIGFRPVDLAHGRTAEVDNNSVVYRGVGPETDLVFQARTDGVKEVLRLNAPLPLGKVPKWRSELVLDGVTPRVGEEGAIVFDDEDGETVAHIPVGVATDSSQNVDARGLTPRTPVRPLLLPTDEGWAVELLVDPVWLNDPTRVYPTYIDPTATITSQWELARDFPGADVVIGSGCGNCRYNGGNDLTFGGQVEEGVHVDKVGVQQNYTPPHTQATGRWEWKSLLQYDVERLKGHPVRSASLHYKVYGSVCNLISCIGNPIFNVLPIEGDWSPQTVTWDSQPSTIATTPKTATLPLVDWHLDVTAWVGNWLSETWPARGLMLYKGTEPHYRLYAMEESGSGVDPYIDVTIEDRIPTHTQDQLSPGHGSTISTLTPRLTAPNLVDPDGDQLDYWIQVGTSSDGNGGFVVNSGWLKVPSYPVPAGSLRNGTTYCWQIYVRDRFAPIDPVYRSSPPACFKVDARLGTSGPSPFDTVGPVTVNLATGSAVVNASTPAFSTVGGAIGADLTYNSELVRIGHGLLGTYVDDADPDNRLVRIDPSLDLSFGSSFGTTYNPFGGVPSEYFSATWTGYIRVPTAGTWRFGGSHDDGLKISIGDPLAVVLDNPNVGDDQSAPVTLGENQRVPVKIEFKQGAGTAHLQLRAWGPGLNGVAVPADWLYPDDNEGLPPGWSMTVGTGELLYAKATIGDTSVVLSEPDGEVHQYVKQADGQTWKPTNVNDDVVVSTTENGAFRLVVEGDDGLTYTFDDGGRLIRVRSSLDDGAPASAEYTIDPSSKRVSAVTDPLSGRRLELVYAPAAGGWGSCPQATGFTPPPGGMLCQIKRPDQSVSNLFYSDGLLKRIENRGVVPAGQSDPGPEVTDFGYADGRLVTVRDPLGYDAVQAPAPFGRPNDDSTLTRIAYFLPGEEALYTPPWRVKSVTGPLPLANDPAPSHGYIYDGTFRTETKVTVAGITPPSGQDFARKVTYDQSGRTLTDTGLDGLTSTKQWETNADRLLSATDTTGRRTTTLYDHAGRPVDSYGPAPAAWFDAGTRLPLPAHAGQVPRTSTAYDEGLRGLAGQFWDNETLSGPSEFHRLGVGDQTGQLVRNWGSGSPDGLDVVDGFSGRFTGEITFPAGGYKVEGCADDGIRAWVDDTLVVDRWTSVGCTTSTWTSPADGKPHRLRVEYHETTGTTDLGLYWLSPGGTRSLVPGSALAPRYGMVTSTTNHQDPTTTADDRRTATEYAAPETGLATRTVVDPAGLGLATEVGYEPSGTGYLRRLSRKLPAQTYDGQVRVDGPAAYWRLGEAVGPTARDDSGNGRNATYPSAATLRKAGATGVDPAVLVDYDPISAGDVLDMAGTQAFTVEAWVKPDFLDGEWRRVLSKETTDANGRQGWLVWVHNDTFGFERFRDGVVDVVTGGLVSAGQWTHLAAVYGSSTVRLNVDGVQVASATASRSLKDTTAPLLIGDELYGAVDEAAVYTTELSATRIAAHRRAAHPYLDAVKTDGAAAHWRLTETNGSTALDSSGNNRTATYQAVELGEPGLLPHDTAARGWGSIGAGAGDVLDRAGTAAFSLEAWVNPDVTDGDWRSLLSKTTSDANGRQGWTVWLHENTVGFERFRDDWSPDLTGGTVTAGTWTHVVVTYSGTTSRLYVNGAQVASVSDSRSILDTTGSLLIGDNLVGRITQAAVYPSALSAAKVAAHHRNGVVDQGGTTSSYYGAAETRTNPCPSGGSAVQSGLARLAYGADPDGSGTALGRADETVYDVLGRVVATRIGTEAWSCTTYDARGRVKSRSFPAFGGEPARTVTHDHAVGGDPLTTSVTDAAGTITTRVDLLGRVASYTDVWGKTTTTTYDLAGRVTQTSGPGGQVGTDYRQNGWVDAQRLVGDVIARPTYSAVGELDGVSYPSGTGNRGNDTSLVVERDETSGRTKKLTWGLAGGTVVSDEVAYTVGGGVRDEKIDGVDHHVGDDFVYDAAGRLVDAWVPGHVITYAYAGSGGCGQSALAGRSTNRTSVTDNATTYTSCYDTTDKLTSTTDPRYASIAHDTRGNTTTLGGETLVYDGANNHVATTKAATTVRYVRDALGRIVERRVNGTTVARYSYDGSDDSATAVLDATNTIVETTVSLVGGVLLTTRAAGDVWSYPNIHGDVMATANPSGVKVGSTLDYDPYGQPLGGTPDNSAGNLDYGWLGRHQRPVETQAGIATVEMGARPYVPGLGRFLEVDPVEGGCANDYVYVFGDPVNVSDPDGEAVKCKAHTIRMWGAKATLRRVQSRRTGMVSWEIDFRAVGDHQKDVRWTSIAARADGYTPAVGTDKHRRTGNGRRWSAHTVITVAPGTEINFWGFMKFSTWSQWTKMAPDSITLMHTCLA